MADKKISALTAATTPLAGTEVLPIVQSGTTVKVAVSDLTAGRAVSSGNFTYTGTLTGSTSIINIGSSQIYKDASGNVGIGTSSPIGVAGYGWLTINGSSAGALSFSSGNTEGFRIQYTAGLATFLSGIADQPVIIQANNAEVFRAASGGNITAAGIYAATVGATNRDVFVDNTGLLGYVSSILASKTNIDSLTDANWLYDLRPVSFHYRQRDEEGNYTDAPEKPLEYGLIAEEVEAINTELVFYDQMEDGPALRGVSYSKLIVPILSELQNLRKRVDAMENAAN